MANNGQKVGQFHLKLWRWHFYAGVFSIPFMIILALSGLIYLFRTEIDAILYSDRIHIPASSLQAQNTPQNLQSQWLSAINELTTKNSGVLSLKSVVPPARKEMSTKFVFLSPEADREFSVYVDPYSSKVLGTVEESLRPSAVALKAHSELFVGQFGDLLLELAASWTILLVGTGLFLWTPRCTSISQMLFPKFKAKGREFWRSLHGTAGVWISAFLLFFCLTGLFWSGVWGAKIVKPWNSFPDVLWNNIPKSDLAAKELNYSAEKHIPWALEDTELPKSTAPHHADSNLPTSGSFNLANSKVTLDKVQKLADESGMFVARSISVPKDSSGVFSVSAIAESAPQEQMIHIDQYSGRILANIGFADYPWLAKSVSTSIALHEGRQLGEFNKWLVAFLCILLTVLCSAACVLWWKRRPTWNQWRAPSRVPLVHAKLPILVCLSLFCIFFPTAGISLGLVWLLDKYIIGNKSTSPKT
jgi:uncharacterized iron-regulated membrane protein